MTPGIIQLPKISNDPDRGNLTFIEDRQIPFKIKRVYYLYDVPGGTIRGGHAHRHLQQILIALSGSFEVELLTGDNSETYFLNRGYEGLYIPPMYWRALYNFSSGAVCLVLASEYYDESDYIRDYQDYMRDKK